MKLSVIKYLNTRSGPSTSAACDSFKSPGDILDIDDLVPGTPIDGNSVWYHCKTDGCYYWSGGTEPTAELLGVRANGLSYYSPAEMLEIYESAANEVAADYAARITGFKGLAAGYKQTAGQTMQTVALVFYVSDKTKTPLPSEVIPNIINYRGYQLVTDVRQLNKVKLLNGTINTNIASDKGPSYPMGGSISEILDDGTQESFGTRTLLVTKQDDDDVSRTYLLSCYHVACNSLFENDQYQLDDANVKVSIPSNIVSPGYPLLAPATVKYGEFGASYDYALITVDVGKFKNTMPGYSFSGYYSLGEIKNNFLENKTLVKYGATTLQSTGSYRTYHTASVEVADGILMSGLIETSGMCQSGDSGSPVIDINNNKLVGFIVAGITEGTDFERNTFILPFAQLDFQFSITPKI